jgi:GNAT superfamily N-acetyltransferase
VRLVAIVPEMQRQGRGRAMSDLIDAEARRWGLSKLLINAHESAVGFYQRTGWVHETWDQRELVGVAAHCTQMTKQI